MPFKILDIYIVRKFLGTFFFALLLFTMVAVIIDLTEKVDSFINNSVPFWAVVTEYYLNFIPYIDALLSPLFIFITVIFFTSKLASDSEIIAMMSSGMNFYRLLIPYLVGAGILVSLLLVVNHYIVPESNKQIQKFEITYLDNKKMFLKINRTLQMQILDNRFIYVENFNQHDTVGYKFTYEVKKEEHLTYKLRADRISWVGAENKWRLNNYTERIFERQHEIVRTGTVLDTSLGFQPKDMDVRLSIKEEMKTPELREHIQQLKLRGSEDLPFYQIEYYRRSADAFMAIILTLIGFSLASRKVRGGTGMHIVMGFALSSIYILFAQFTKTFSTNDNLHPFLGVWIPNFTFGLLAIYLIFKAQK